jgi:hypothetical protein
MPPILEVQQQKSNKNKKQRWHNISYILNRFRDFIVQLMYTQ